MKLQFFHDHLQMNLIIRTVRWYWKNWKTLTVKQIIWILHSLKCPMRDMHENGVSPNYPPLFISENDSQAYTEVHFGRFFQSLNMMKLLHFVVSFEYHHTWNFIIGDLLSEDEVLEWLRKNRFRQPELNIFMYIILAISIAFVLYTAFLLQFFKPTPAQPPPVKQ